LQPAFKRINPPFKTKAGPDGGPDSYRGGRWVGIKQSAQMAESVDALVSNTCGRKAVPVRPRLWVQEKPQIF
jgi:hypothetical protein